MKIVIEIPKEFEQDFMDNRFEDALQKFVADAHLVAGNYEKETAEMLISAFKNSKEYDLDHVIEKLEDRIQHHKKLIEYERNCGTSTEKAQHRKAVSVLEEAIGIVKNVEVEIEKGNCEEEQEL